MKAIVKPTPFPGTIDVWDVPEPKVGEREVLLRISGAAICGSDLKIYNWEPRYHYIKPPIILGHEAGGYVVEIGAEIKKVKKGDKVVVEPFISCGRCPYCLGGKPYLCDDPRIVGVTINGGLAEYTVVPETNIHKVPPTIPDEILPMLEIFAIGVHALESSSFRAGDKALVFGPGPLGMCLVLALKYSGASRILLAGVREDAEVRLPIGRKLGAEAVVVSENPIGELKTLAEAAGQTEIDVIFEASGSPQALLNAISIIKKGGQVIQIGFQSKCANILIDDIVFKSIELRGIVRRTQAAWRRAINLVSANSIDLQDTVTKVVKGLDRQSVETAFAELKQKDQLKIVFKPG